MQCTLVLVSGLVVHGTCHVLIWLFQKGSILGIVRSHGLQADPYQSYPLLKRCSFYGVPWKGSLVKCTQLLLSIHWHILEKGWSTS